MHSFRIFAFALIAFIVIEAFAGCGGTSTPIDPPSGLVYSTNPATYTLGLAIPPNNPTSSGGSAGSYAVSPALPPGLSLNTSTGVIGGTPTVVAAVANYTVTATNSAGSTTAILNIRVIPAGTPPTNLTYSTNPAVYVVGRAIAANSPVSGGGAADLFSVAPSLPLGLSLNPSSGVIGGTPTVATAEGNYVVTAANLYGSSSASVVITVIQTTDVSVYWEFDRNTFIAGVTGIVPYDTNVNWPPATGSRACPESGVDYVSVTDLNGLVLAPNVPCVNQSVQGVALSGFPGNNTYIVTGWRTGRPLPLFRGQVIVNVGNGPPPYFGTAIAAGIPDLLTVDAFLADPANPLGYATCGLAGIDEFQGWIEDGLKTLVWARNPVRCGPSDSPGISFGPVDRDMLYLWMDAIDNRVNPPDIHWSRCGYAQPSGFAHFAGGEDRFSLNLDLGACNNPPPP